MIGLHSFAEAGITAVHAPEDIYVETGNGIGTKMLLYREGDLVRAEHVELLGLQHPARKTDEPPKDKAKRGPREAPKASRDQQLTDKTKEE